MRINDAPKPEIIDRSRGDIRRRDRQRYLRRRRLALTGIAIHNPDVGPHDGHSDILASAQRRNLSRRHDADGAAFFLADDADDTADTARAADATRAAETA